MDEVSVEHCAITDRSKIGASLEEERKGEIVAMDSRVAHKRVGFKRLGEKPAIDRASNRQVP
ncbi:hypothetical protein Csa_013523 [Cucumis sativus]|nr:hypothetical protein Csa_013523 [Cucumis sativus]